MAVVGPGVPAELGLDRPEDGQRDLLELIGVGLVSDEELEAGQIGGDVGDDRVVVLALVVGKEAQIVDDRAQTCLGQRVQLCVRACAVMRVLTSKKNLN